MFQKVFGNPTNSEILMVIEDIFNDIIENDFEKEVEFINENEASQKEDEVINENKEDEVIREVTRDQFGIKDVTLACDNKHN